MFPKRNRKKFTALKIAFIYLVVSSLWILFSDQLILGITDRVEVTARLQTIKGWVYTLVVTGLLYELIRRSRRSLEQANNLLLNIIEGTPDAIFVKNWQGRYILCNTATAKALNCTTEEVVGKSDRDLFGEAEAQEIVENERSILESGQPQTLEETVQLSQETKTFLSNKYIWRSRQGQPKGIIGIARDITERKQLLEDLRRQTHSLQALSAVTANAISTLELDDLLHVLLQRIAAVIAADAAIIFLYDNGTLYPRCGVGIPERKLERYGQISIRGLANAIATQNQPIYIEDIQRDKRFRAASEKTRSWMGVPLKRNGNFVGVLQIEWHDLHPYSEQEIHLLEITAERCAMAILNAQLYETTKQLQERLQLQIERMPIGCILHDRQMKFTDWNPAAAEIFGYSKSEVLGKHPYELIVPAALQSEVEEIFQTLKSGHFSARSVNKNITKDGHLITCEWHNTSLRDAKGNFTGVLSMVKDITEHQSIQDRMWRYAFYDAVTQLPKTELFLKRLEQMLQEYQNQERGTFALFYLSLDRFQFIKYSLGHNIAKQLCMAVARRLESYSPTPAMLARIEGDEFAIILETVAEHSDAIHICQQIQNELVKPFHLSGHEIFTTASIGVVLSSLPNIDAESFLQAADTAMHSAQIQDTANNYVVFDEQMQAEATRKFQLDLDLRRALDNQELMVYYQPIVSISDRRLSGFEALLRWQHPLQGFISPAEFIPLAEEIGLISSLGMWVLYETCQQIRAWQQAYQISFPLTVSVNISAMQLKQPNFIEQIDSILNTTGIDPQNLKLEITESVLVENTQQIIRILEQLKARKLSICIDDFGTGYSSLSYLHSFPFDTLKIDRSFVRRIGIETESESVMHTIVVLARNLNMEIIAEGIETLEQLAHLQNLGCEYGQGYLFSRPEANSAIAQLLASGNLHL
ncbi:EAL domain-containing protein [Geitlerinema sp. PCC 9228]|uniref:sensor domain-containing protein n=1 Tax=Geitlerinema sp. PCC 9228 TaxID=111611 RepID=UPI0008F9B954|nr:EAL domain-containing protein [Geitlerinema sp. PCC 9228]